MKKLLIIFFLWLSYSASASASWVNYDYLFMYTKCKAQSDVSAADNWVTRNDNSQWGARWRWYNPNRDCGNYDGRIVLQKWDKSIYGEPPETNCDSGGLGYCAPQAPQCSTDTISGGPITGGSGSGIFDVQGCAYTCGTDYSKLDGNTTLYDANFCTGTGQEYVSSDPSDYSEPPSVCAVKDSLGACLDMDKQQGGACPAGTTYGRLNDTEVCVPSGTSPDPLDPGSQGLPEQGGDMQAEGTPDRAGTGGSSTGTGTGSSSGTSTTTDNGDGTSTTVTTETKETNGPLTVGGHGDPASWWESQYPDGAAGIASKFSEDVGNGPFMAILNPLKSLPDGGVAPSWSLDFGIGQMGNYGSHSFELPAGVWAFVRFAILFTTVMTVRKLIFGG